MRFRSHLKQFQPALLSLSLLTGLSLGVRADDPAEVQPDGARRIPLVGIVIRDADKTELMQGAEALGERNESLNLGKRGDQ